MIYEYTNLILFYIYIILLIILILYYTYKMLKQKFKKILKRFFNFLEIKRLVLKKPKVIKKVSVVIPNYNYAQYIEERIDSILKQTYPIYEIIILDDKSRDNSVEIIEKKIEKIKKKYPNINIKFVLNKENSGNVFKQWTKAFELSTGDFLWIAEADDLSNKYFLNVTMQGFENEDVIISYTESAGINEKGKIFKENLRDWIDIFNSGKWEKNYINSGKKELQETMCINNTIANVSSAVFNKKKKCDFLKFLREAQEFTLAGDWYFYSKVLLSGSIAYKKISLNYYRLHSNSVSATTDNFIHFNEIMRIQNSIKKDVKLPSSSIRKIKKRRDILKNNFGISKDELYYQNISLQQLIQKNKIEDEILLSIIVPVYNTGKYLNRCFKSFIKYLPYKTEVIIINDGSTDDSEKIILEYMKKYPEIKYIKKENGGISSVKNIGLKEAKGRYITFLDSDDYVSSNMHSTMLKKAIDKSADLIYCDVFLVYEDNRIQYRNMTNYDREKGDIMQHIDSNLMPASWNKLVKRELYENVEFPDKINNEDVTVSPILLYQSKKTIKVESPFYKYFQRTGSIQNSGFNTRRFDIFDATKILFDNIKIIDEEDKEKIQGAILTHQLIAMLMYLIIPIEDKKERIKFIEMFCQKYNELEVIENNRYVQEFLKKYKIEELTNYIKNNNTILLDSYMREKYSIYTRI